MVLGSSFVRLAGVYLVFLWCVGCGSSETEVICYDSDGGASTCFNDAGIEEDGAENLGSILAAPELSLESCPGYQTKDTYPESYKEFCAEFVTPALLETGNGCFYVTDPGALGGYCKICALQGIELNCVNELCN